MRRLPTARLLLVLAAVAGAAHAQSLSIGDAVVTEGDAGLAQAIFAVTLSAESSAPLRVAFATRDGAATAADGDYRSAAGQLVFEPGETVQAIVIDVVGDTRVEPDEGFFVDLLSGSLPNAARVAIADGEGAGLIRNDDDATLSIDDASFPEGDEGTLDAVFTVTLSAAVASTVTVGYSTRNGSASAGRGDFRAASGSLTYAPGTTVATLAVTIRGDRTVEADEVFFVDLSAAMGATIADGEARGTILNDDFETDLVRLVEVPPTGEGAGAASVTVERSGAGSGAASVTVSALPGTASEGEDFVSASRVLSWSSGEVGIRSFSVRILDDGLAEGDETISIQLSNPSGAALGSPSRLELVILDDDLDAALVAVGPTEVAADVDEEIELRVRVQREDGSPVAGARVLWEVEGEVELTGGGESESDDEGIASRGLRLGNSPGRATARARLEEAREEVVFGIAVGGDLDDLFDERNPGEDSVADALNEICESEVGSFDPVCDYIFGLDPDEQRQAIEELTPKTAVARARMAQESVRVQLRNVAQRLRAVRARSRDQPLGQLAISWGRVGIAAGSLRGVYGQSEATELIARVERAMTDPREEIEAAPPPAVDIDEPSRWGFYVNGRLTLGDRPASSRERGFDIETQGVTAGADYRVNDRFVLGGALGLLDVSADVDRGGEIDVEGYSLAAYSTYYRGGLWTEAILALGRNEYDEKRSLVLPRPFDGDTRLVASSTADGRQVSFALGLGYDAAVGALGVGGFSRISRVDGEIDPSTESGTGLLSLAIENQDVESMLVELGLDLTYAAGYSWGVLQPDLQASILRELEDDSRLIRGRFARDPDANEFAVPTASPDRDYFSLALGLTATLPRGKALYLYYDTDLGREDFNLYTFTFGFRWEG